VSNNDAPGATPADPRVENTQDNSRPSPSAVRARLAVSVHKLLYGTLVGAWAARVPDIRATAGANDATWGIANSVDVATGLLMLFAIIAASGHVEGRYLVRGGAVIAVMVTPFAASAPNIQLLILGLIIWACASAQLEAPLRALAMEVQRHYGRFLLGSFDACFSFGAFAGAGAGIGTAAVGITPGIQIGACSLVLGSLVAITWTWLPTDPLRHEPKAGIVATRRLRRRVTPQLLLLTTLAVLLAFVTSAGEQWAAIYTADGVGGGAAMGAATYASWVLASAAGLLLVDRIVSRVDALGLLRVSLAPAALGLAIGLWLATPAAAVTGFAIMGLFMAAAGPVLVAIAGSQPGLTPAEGISIYQLGVSPGFLISPLLIGMLASAFGLRVGLSSVVLAFVIVVILSFWLRNPGDPVRHRQRGKRG